jgi:hypothetical protein
MKVWIKPLHNIMAHMDRPPVPPDLFSDSQQIAISIYSMFCIWTKSATHLHACTNLIGLTCLLDFRKSRPPDILFHHVVTILMTTFVEYHKTSIYQSPYPVYDAVRTILAIEIPTILLAVEKYIPSERAKLKVAVQSAFALFFFYYRIYRYARYIIFNTEAKRAIDSTGLRPMDHVHIYGGIYGMFLLNLYWFSMIVRKGAKILLGK